MGGKRSGVYPIKYRSLERLLSRRDETSRKRGNQWDKQNQDVKTPKRCDAPYIVTNTQEGRVRVRMLPLTVAQKNGNHFQIIVAHHIFLSSNTGIIQAPQISSPQVRVIAYLNVSLKCLAFVRPSDCWDNSLRWYFNNSSGELKSGEKYDIQERKTNTKCKTAFILTIVNVTEADEGKYKCQWLCENDDPISSSKSSIIQLKVFPPPEEGTDTPVISKGLVSRNLSNLKSGKPHQIE